MAKTAEQLIWIATQSVELSERNSTSTIDDKKNNLDMKKLIPIMSCQACSFILTAMFVRRVVESPIAEFSCLALSLILGTIIGLKLSS